MDHLLFWPIGQMGLATYMMDVVEAEMQGDKGYDISMVKKALKNINKIDWDLFSGPWYGYALHKVSKGKEGRVKQKAPEISYKVAPGSSVVANIADMIGFLMGRFAQDKKQTDQYRDEWEGKLIIYKNTPELIEKLWKQTLSTRKKITGT